MDYESGQVIGQTALDAVAVATEQYDDAELLSIHVVLVLRTEDDRVNSIVTQWHANPD